MLLKHDSCSWTESGVRMSLHFVGLQARDPSVHAAILAHLNQKYGSGSGPDPSSTEKNTQVSPTRSSAQVLSCWILIWEFYSGEHGSINFRRTKDFDVTCRSKAPADLLTFWFFQDQASPKDKDVPKPTTDLSEDLFKVHDFDVKIDLQVPNAGEASRCSCCFSTRSLSSVSNAVAPPPQRPSRCRSAPTLCPWRTALHAGRST